MNRKSLVRSVALALFCAILYTFSYLTLSMHVTTVRNGEEYCDAFLDGQEYQQEMMLAHTAKIHVSVLPTYIGETDAGIEYTLIMKDSKRFGFIPLMDLTNGEWTTLVIKTENMKYYGPATLVLRSVGMTIENNVQLLIVTNTLQLEPECLLYKDGVEIPNGRIDMAYKTIHMDLIPVSFCVSLAVAFIVILLFPYIRKSFRMYPVAYATALLFLANLIARYPSLYEINRHCSGQYFFTWRDLGFSCRTLLGSLIDILHIDFTIDVFVTYGVVSIGVLLGLELAILYDPKHKRGRHGMEKCFLLFLCMPFAATQFFNGSFFARFDEVLIIFFLLSCVLIIKERMIFLLPVISFFGTLTHEMYLPMFIPFIFCILLYKYVLTKKRKYLLHLATSSIVSIGMTVYGAFFSKPLVPMATAWEHIQARGDPALIWDYPLGFSFYRSTLNKLQEGWDLLFIGKTIPMIMICYLVLLPIILVAAVWLHKMYKAQNTLAGKLTVMLFPFTVTGLVVCMITTSDWGRLLVMFGIAVFFAFLTVWDMDPGRVESIVSEIWGLIRAKYGDLVYPVMCFAYLFLSSYGGGASYDNLFLVFEPIIP